jgi:hypothetical protein
MIERAFETYLNSLSVNHAAFLIYIRFNHIIGLLWDKSIFAVDEIQRQKKLRQKCLSWWWIVSVGAPSIGADGYA